MKKFLFSKQFILLELALLFLCFHSFGQNIDSTIEKYADDYGQEKIYLQYDKSTYAPGETIWFKAFLIKDFFPSEQSKNLYADWTDDNGKLLFRSVSPMVEGTANGQFDIPETYSGTFIHVKAYTKWMLNFDSDFLYNKDLRILSKTSNSSHVKTKVIFMLQFFPEGGDIIAGVTNKIAFKANDQWGRPVNIKGVIQDNMGKIMDSLHVIHNGMGYFFITPQHGETFTAKWSVRSPSEKDEKETERNTDLPLIRTNGVSLQVTLSGTKRNFSIKVPADVAANFGQVFVVGTLNQHLIFKIAKDISSGIARGIIPTESLPSGILTITVFDKLWHPLSERITYINNEEYLFHPEMTVQHWGLNKRARNEIVINVPDSSQSNLSVSVTDAGIDADSSDNVISHLLLTGDLRGQLYNPSYYFSNTSDSISQQLDLVMLTHGWRRFKWEDVTKGKFPRINYPKDSTYLTLSGKVYGVLPSELKQGGMIIMIVSKKKGDGKMVMLPIQPNGIFNDSTFFISDTIHVYYQLPKKRFGDALVEFMENLLPPFSFNTAAKGFFDNNTNDTSGDYKHLLLAAEMNDLLKKYEGKVLENVIVTSKTKSPLEIMDQKYTSGLFSGGDGYQFDMVNDISAAGYPSIFYYLQGKIAGLQINTSNTPPSLQWRGGSPQLYIDEVPSDIDMLSSIPMTDVAYVKVFRPPFMGGFGGGSNGAVAVYTRRGDDVKSETGKGLTNNTISGYTAIREFYSPNYGTFKSENDKKDIRTTLYWNPQVVTTSQMNKVTLTFYNNDVTQSFRVVIEGMTKDGRLAHVEQIIE